MGWRSEEEELAAGTAMDTGGDWTKEPDSPSSGDQPSPSSNWADFNAAFGSNK